MYGDSGTNPIPLTEQLVDRANRSPDAHVTVVSLLRTLAAYITHVGRDEDPSAEIDLFRVRAAGTDRWLENLAHVVELDSCNSPWTLT